MLVVAVVVGIVVFIGLAALIVAKFYRRVEQGQALIVNTFKGADPAVTFKGMVVIPIINLAEVMDISVKTIEIDRRGKDGLICKDNIRADIKVAFFVRVNKTKEDVLKVAQAIGCARASQQVTLETLFTAKFSEALKTVGKRLDFESLYLKRDDFKDQIIEVIGKDLNGYVLDDAAIDYLEQTDLKSLDASNILDAQGIRKITQITAAQAVQTNDLKQEERKAITKQNVEADEAVLELERQKADAVAKQNREILTMQAREQAETLKVQAEEKKKAEMARIAMEEEVQIGEENKQRQVEVAVKNRERVIGVEAERVEKDKNLEAISRERAVELQRIDKEKALEKERKIIADVIAGRIAVEKQVAEEEERIKDLRLVMEAKRNKEATVIGAEAAAQEKLVMTIKEAEAQEQVAKHKAKETVTLAEADLEAADRVARSKMRIAEGVQAEEAAAGLAAVKVKEADAVAIEKQGQAEARVTYEKLSATAKGEEEKGMATVRVREADAAAVEKQGQATADAAKQMLIAEAKGAEEKGMAEVKIKEADAAAVEKQGQAEAVAIKVKMEAEADGLTQKAQALQQLGGEAREHEEFRIRLEKDKDIEMAQLHTRHKIAIEQARVMGEAMSNAKINIVGGDGQFLERFFNAVSLGQAVDGAVDNSELLQNALHEYVEGDASFRDDLKDVLTRPALTAEGVKNLSVAGALRKVMVELDSGNQAKLQGLLDRAKELGIE
jgi:uncharacterized membrane protein YqiK